VYIHVLCDCVEQLDKDCFHNLLFGDYMMPDREPEERVYEEVKSVSSFHQIVEQYLEDYNNVHKTHMNLVIFRFAFYICTDTDFYFFSAYDKESSAEGICFPVGRPSVDL